MFHSKRQLYMSFFVFSPSELIFGCFPFALEVVAGYFTAAHKIKMFKYLIGLLVGEKKRGKQLAGRKISKYRPTRNDLLRDTGQTVKTFKKIQINTGNYQIFYRRESKLCHRYKWSLSYSCAGLTNMGWLFFTVIYVGCHVGAIYKRGQPLKKENNNLKRKTTTNPNVCIK